MNGIENATWYAGRTEHILTPEFAERHGRPDVLITDPPAGRDAPKGDPHAATARRPGHRLRQL